MTPHDLPAIAARAKEASRVLAKATGDQRNAFLTALAEGLANEQARILEANARDLEVASRGSLNEAFIDRLTLTGERIGKMAFGAGQIGALPDPVGSITHGHTRGDGLRIRKQRVPLGVIAIIFESRPNVVIDAAALCIKAGNACILKGGKEAFASQEALIAIIRRALAASGLPEDACVGIATSDREVINTLLKQTETVDVAIPRGGEGLIRHVAQEALIPVIKHYQGICHVYIDAEAGLAMAQSITLNAKVQRPGVCNAAETLLVHEAIAAEFLPSAIEVLRAEGVEIRGCPETAKHAAIDVEATEDDWRAEYLDTILAVRVVPSLEAALDHIARYGSAHTDAIVTRNIATADAFVAGVDSASVMVNASTRFSDGFEYGLGAEIGISTDKIHARGPMGLESLTTEKWVVTGNGHVRG